MRKINTSTFSIVFPNVEPLMKYCGENIVEPYTSQMTFFNTAHTFCMPDNRQE